jgi:hypothetical protein
MDIEKRRRQVAWLCFKPYLSEEQLVQAIQILDHSFQLEGTINLIGYVAKVCMQFGIDLPTHKILYGKFYQLMSETTDLLTSDSLPSAFENLSALEDIPAEEALLADIPVYNVVFVCFMRPVLEHTPNNIALFVILTELVADKKLKSQDLVGYIEQWTDNPNSFAWSESVNQQTLTRLVHLVYMALCELFGPVAADDCFHKALTICERRPEARLFPPSQFL